MSSCVWGELNWIPDIAELNEILVTNWRMFDADVEIELIYTELVLSFV